MIEFNNTPSFEDLKARGDAAMEEFDNIINKLHDLLRLAACEQQRTQANLENAADDLQSGRHSDLDVPAVSIMCAGGCEAQFELERFAADDFSDITRSPLMNYKARAATQSQP